MRRGQIALWVALLVLSIGDARLAMAQSPREVAGIRLPPRSRPMPDGRYSSSLGFKKSVVYFERYLRSRSLPHTQVPTTEARGVLLSRFLSESESSPWLAIHVYQVKGVTSIFIVSRQGDQAPSEKPSRP